jgi:hypothetical protein
MIGIVAFLLALAALAAALGVVYAELTGARPIRTAVSFVVVNAGGWLLVFLAVSALGVRA